MNGKMVKIAIAVTAAAILAPAALWASTSAGGRGERREPPPEAFTACQGKSEGDAVEVTTPDGKTLKAVCRQLNSKLAALPQMGGSGRAPGNGPPPQQ
jgi:hypothetical protein